MKRTAASMILCALALVLGVATAQQSAQNRARAEELTRRHRTCEGLERQNELQRVDNLRLEWLVLEGREDEFPGTGAESGAARSLDSLSN